MLVTARLFAGARAAAGTRQAAVTVPAGASVSVVLDAVTTACPGLAGVLPACSVLLDGTAAAPDRVIGDSPVVIDVLPPFSGG